MKERYAWEIPPIQCYEPEDGVFYAQMGPTGGKRGYPAITGKIILKKKVHLYIYIYSFRTRWLGNFLVH